MTIIHTPKAQARQMKGMLVFIAALVLFIILLRIIGLITDWFLVPGGGLRDDLHRNPPGQNQDGRPLRCGIFSCPLCKSPDRDAALKRTPFRRSGGRVSVFRSGKWNRPHSKS